MSELVELERVLPGADNGAPAAGGLISVEQQRAVSEVQSALTIAKTFPRNVQRAYVNILSACKRYTLAERAIYQYARGGRDIEGPSIRLAEAIAQNWDNLEFGFREVSRDYERDGVPFSEVESYAWDMQTNTRRKVTFRVRHWRDTQKGGYQIKDERDIYELVANQAARRTRNCILALIPGDIVDAAVEQCKRTLEEGQDDATLQQRIAKMVVAFEALGVSREMIEARVQRKVEAITVHQLVDLTKVYNSIRDGIGQIGDFFKTPEPEAAPKDKSRTETLKETLKGKQGNGNGKAEPTPEASQ